MQLLTKEIEKRLQDAGKQNVDNPIVVVKFFNPVGAGTWWVTALSEYRLKNEKEDWKYTDSFDAKEEAIKNGYKVVDIILFGYVSIFGDHCDEWGDFSLNELLEIKGFGGLGIERDLHCGEKPINEFHIPSLKVK